MSPPSCFFAPAWFGYCHTGGALGDKKEFHFLSLPHYLVCFQAIQNFLLFGSVSGLKEESINMTPKVSVKKKKNTTTKQSVFLFFWQLFLSLVTQVC